jgi:penicillin amidase
MKFFKLFLSLIITVGLAITLNTKIKTVPPLGKFLSPASGFWRNAEPVGSREDDEVVVPGLQNSVEVTYDQFLVPHIFAQNDYDLYYTQGYVTASHRLWQMELQTHFAGGRVSEIVGPMALDLDRTSRRKGMVFAAERAIEEMLNNPKMKVVVEAYADGINQYISELSYEDYPIEYKLLDYAPEEWTIIKSGLLLKYMANDLNFHERDLQNTNGIKLFGRDLFDLLYPDRELAEDPIVDKPGGWEFEAIAKDSITADVVDETIARALVSSPNPDNGSNNWAISGSKSASGNTILSSDPHLGLNLPSLWYITHLNAPGVNVMGATLPGSPNVIIGYTDSIAWGVTNAQRDLVDWYKIEFKDDSKSAYLLDGNWVEPEMVIEEIKIRGEEPFIDTVYYTHFGPVMYDDKFKPDSEKKFYALRWVAHDPSEEAFAFYLLNRAKNHADYMNALDHYVSPAQNFAFASASGDIAMRIQGKYPNKRFEEGKFLLDGTTTENDWTFIPYEHNVMYKNPERGFISSANQYPADSTYPYYIHAASYETYRNRRINGVLRETEGASVQTMMTLQNDNYNLKAAESLGVFLDALDSVEMDANEVEAFNQLVSWDFYNNVDSKGASYYERWWDILYPMIWDEMSSSEIPLAYPTSYTTIKLIKEQPNLSFFDLVSTTAKENAEDILLSSFRKMAMEMAVTVEEDENGADWANFKGTYVKHLLNIPAFSSYEIPIGGNHNIVNATSKNHGPSWRMVVELDPKGAKGFGIYPGGQSGNPGSFFYDNYIESWAMGNYLELQLTNEAAAIKDPITTLILTPEK